MEKWRNEVKKEGALKGTGGGEGGGGDWKTDDVNQSSPLIGHLIIVDIFEFLNVPDISVSGDAKKHILSEVLLAKDPGKEQYGPGIIT